MSCRLLNCEHLFIFIVGTNPNNLLVCENYFDTFTAIVLCRHHFGRPGLESKLRAIQTVSVLLQGPSDVGNRTLEMSGMMDAVISLCASEVVCHQQVAVEALIHAAGKAKRASFITANGVALLKDLYKKSENDQIRVRALVVRVQPIAIEQYYTIVILSMVQLNSQHTGPIVPLE